MERILAMMGLESLVVVAICLLMIYLSRSVNLG